MRRCVICKEEIWNPISPKSVIFHALSLLEIDKWEEFLTNTLRDFKVIKSSFKGELIKYLNEDLDVPICWGCAFDIVYENLKRIDENAAEEFKKFADPTGL